MCGYVAQNSHVRYFCTFVPVRTCTASRSKLPHSRFLYLPPGSFPPSARLSTDSSRRNRRPPVGIPLPSWVSRSCNRARNSLARSAVSLSKAPSLATASSSPPVRDLRFFFVNVTFVSCVAASLRKIDMSNMLQEVIHQFSYPNFEIQSTRLACSVLTRESAIVILTK